MAVDKRVILGSVLGCAVAYAGYSYIARNNYYDDLEKNAKIKPVAGAMAKAPTLKPKKGKNVKQLDGKVIFVPDPNQPDEKPSDEAKGAAVAPPPGTPATAAEKTAPVAAQVAAQVPPATLPTPAAATVPTAAQVPAQNSAGASPPPAGMNPAPAVGVTPPPMPGLPPMPTPAAPIAPPQNLAQNVGQTAGTQASQPMAQTSGMPAMPPPPPSNQMPSVPAPPAMIPVPGAVSAFESKAVAPAEEKKSCDWKTGASFANIRFGAHLLRINLRSDLNAKSALLTHFEGHAKPTEIAADDEGKCTNGDCLILRSDLLEKAKEGLQEFDCGTWYLITDGPADGCEKQSSAHALRLSSTKENHCVIGMLADIRTSGSVKSKATTSAVYVTGTKPEPAANARKANDE